MPKYAANYYTGANVSIFIGPNLVTQVYGISWDVHDSKRPVYGYNSMYYDAVVDGRILVTGQLYINLTKANYLSIVLKRYHEFISLVETANQVGTTDDVIGYLRANENVKPLLRVLRELIDAPLESGRPVLKTEAEADAARRLYGHNYIPELISWTNPELEQPPIGRVTDLGVLGRLDSLPVMMGDSERTQSLDAALSYIFNNEDVRSDLIRTVTGGVLTSNLRLDDLVLEQTTNIFSVSPTDRLDSLVERNRHRERCGDDLMEFATPSQFGNAAQGPLGIDILVQFGPPVGEIVQNAAFNYQDNTSFIIRDARFVGEAGQIMSDSQPIMEVYNFIARKKDLIPSSETIRG